MAVPLDQIVCSAYNDKTGREEKLPALHPRWRESVTLVAYRPPPLVSDPAEVEEHAERVRFIVDDLRWLLKLSHQQFWCQVIFDESVHQCIDSYLRYAPRSYDAVFNLPEDVQKLQTELHRLVFMVCLRMATHKESKEHFITPEEFGKILYENYIFDIPKLMDLSVLYGAGSHGNRPLLTKMINNIFVQQPGYADDLKAIVPTILEVLQNISKQCGVDPSGSSLSPVKIAGGANIAPTSTGNHGTLVAMEMGKFQDVVFYLSDTAQTLWTFLQIYTPAATVFLDEEFPMRLAAVCDALFPALLIAFTQRDWASPSHRDLLRRKALYANLCLVKVYRQIVYHGCVQPLLDGCSAEEAERHIEDYLHILTSTLGERRFVAHMEHLFPFREDRDILSQAQYVVDDTRLQFIQDAVNESYAIYGTQPELPGDARVHSGVTGPRGTDNAGAASSGMDDNMTYSGASASADPDSALGACAPKMSGVELDSLIASVRDLLPDVGEGFIELCLEEVNYDLEQVINMLLENRIPTSLQGYNRDMPRRPREPEEEPQQSLVSQRKNVFDNDEFDVFSRDDVNVNNIHKGKKDTDTDASALLDDKSSVSTLRPLYDKYGGEFVETAYGDGGADYDDEYDDTYDTNLVGATDADSMDELTMRRPFTVPRVLGGGATNSPRDDNDDESEEEDEEEVRKRRDHFLQDPAKIREQQAARRQQRQHQKQPQQHRPKQHQQHQESSGGGEKKHDVKGAPKGQGQSSDVLKNRAWKEKNKNKNRRNLADKKRKV